MSFDLMMSFSCWRGEERELLALGVIPNKNGASLRLIVSVRELTPADPCTLSIG